MARLEDSVSGRRFTLFARTILGRSRPCLLRIEQRVVSGEHAAIIWSDGAWVVRDLASKNGTFLDGRRLAPGQAQTLHEGAALGFGGPEHPWRVLDLRPPRMMAVCARSGQVVFAQGDVLALPSEDQPEQTIFEVREEGWCVESESGERAPIDDLDTVQVAGETWRIQLPLEPEGTPLVQVDMTIENTTLEFSTVSGKDAVEVVLVHRGTPKPLVAREHMRVLLALAEARADDARDGAPDPGWRDLTALARTLRMDINAVNVAIFRARRQLAEAGLVDASRVVEVRRGARRFGARHFEVRG